MPRLEPSLRNISFGVELGVLFNWARAAGGLAAISRERPVALIYVSQSHGTGGTVTSLLVF
eukprot:scaffold177399_cov27-Tisochrysis_lutea.AAC.2